MDIIPIIFASENNTSEIDPEFSDTPFRKIRYTMAALLIINTIIFISAIYLTYRLFKLLKCSDFVMLQTILFIDMIVILKEIYLILYIAARQGHDILISNLFFNILLLFGNNFFLMAFVLTSSKWVNFQIIAQSQISGDRLYYEENIVRLKKGTQIANVIITLICMGLMILMMTSDKKSGGFDYEKVYSAFLVGSFSLGLIMLAIVTRKLIVTLRSYYPEFYYEERKYILSMTLILLIAMSAKVVFGIYRFTIPNITYFFIDSERKDDWDSPTYFILGFTISEYLPVTSLLSTFWYGLTRRNKVIKSRKYSNPQSSEYTSSFFGDEEEDEDDDIYSQNPFGIGKTAKIQPISMSRRVTDDENLLTQKTKTSLNRGLS
ncbi:UNKNOWN [Stylonychia lemnae]|uniref:THH1/TOM1/TOM3 domain-containing protein n=1 Tax=Stylonychia lemnae TaxID=5949 RepID=A0A078AHA5_STYLE|nr:UNKNOWN [Stylonychia lemnae]|eukprot:CDW80223.1 UNKNOWN [Stylonychia lemnae]